ncbi:MAG: GreA/GreB family elongation factor, partial [Lachnospiraceae bacterium]
VVVEDEASTDTINIGCRVRLFDVTEAVEVEYAIVGSQEVNSLQGRISNECPVGKALMGSRVDETVQVVLPDGSIDSYKVLGIERNLGI